MGSCRLLGVKWGVGRLGPKPKCVSAEKETALRLGGATAVSEPYFPTRPSAVLPASPSEGAPLGSSLGAEPHHPLLGSARLLFATRTLRIRPLGTVQAHQVAGPL